MDQDVELHICSKGKGRAKNNAMSLNVMANGTGGQMQVNLQIEREFFLYFHWVKYILSPNNEGSM